MISVIIPLYNKEKAIGRCLNSVLSQRYIDFECIVVDDGSTDKSAFVVKSYSDSRIKYIYKENGGVSSARNLGVVKANSEWIVFLDADDYFLEDGLLVLYNCVSQHNALCGCANFVFAYKKEYKLFSSLKSGLVHKPFLLWYMKIFLPRTGNTIIKREILLKHPFKTFLSRYEDFEFFLEITRLYKFYYMNKPVMVYTNDFHELSYRCSNFKNDFVFYMKFEEKKIWERLILLNLLRNGIEAYPQNCQILKRLYKFYYYVCRFEKIIGLVMSCLRKLFWKRDSVEMLFKT